MSTPSSASAFPLYEIFDLKLAYILLGVFVSHGSAYWVYIRAAGGAFGLFSLVLIFAFFQLSRLATGAANPGVVGLPRRSCEN